jgi:hypothetical protein
MKRLHLFEIEDQEWYPNLFREFQTDGMHFMASKMRIFDPVVPLITKTMRRIETSKIVDMCSGGGGPWFHLYEEIAQTIPDAEITLTDKYPSASGRRKAKDYPGSIRYLDESIDATDIPGQLTGMRTIFSGMHHFKPPAVRMILDAAVRSNAAIGVFEYCERRFSRILMDLVMSPPFVWATTPFIKPFKLSRLFWTYLIPVIPVVGTLDGVVSDIRTYSTNELNTIVADIDCPDYVWEIGNVVSSMTKMPITYLLGYPRAE